MGGGGAEAGNQLTELVYVPNDPRLGVYRKEFSDQIMLYESRPDGEGKDLDFFGNPDKMIGSAKLLEQLIKDNDNQVDQLFFLKSR
jgi:hypothetical protein